MGAYNNIGFRKMKGYFQYTLLSILFFNVAYLISIGVYPNPKLTPEEAYNHPTYKSTARLECVGRNPNMARFPDPSGNERVGHPAFPTLPKL